MITNVRLVDQQFETRAGRDRVDFQEGVNILVGANGCGKSSVLNAIKAEVENSDQRIARLVRDTAPVYFYSGETASAAGSGDSSSNSLTVTRLSHGQRLLSYLAGLNTMRGELTIVLDEPELALDFFAVNSLCASMADRPEIQWIIASHHPLLLTWKGANFINMDRNNPNYARDVLRRLRQRLA